LFIFLPGMAFPFTPPPPSWSSVGESSPPQGVRLRLARWVSFWIRCRYLFFLMGILSLLWISGPWEAAFFVFGHSLLSLATLPPPSVQTLNRSRWTDHIRRTSWDFPVLASVVVATLVQVPSTPFSQDHLTVFAFRFSFSSPYLCLLFRYLSFGVSFHYEVIPLRMIAFTDSPEEGL